MSTYLFVYGTLMTSSRVTVAERLRREGRLVGPAWTTGKLYDLGKWPGLRASASVSDVVHGELYEIASPEETFVWIDQYEGISTERYWEAEYVRAPRRVEMADGMGVTAWVYVYRRDVDEVWRLAGGRWYGGGDVAAA